jgi:capsular exopolysaccharide synthesis family protein
VPNQIGLTSLLLDKTLTVEAALHQTPAVGLRLLPSGPLPPNPADLLGSELMKGRLEEITGVADVIVFDSSPILPVADAAILGSLCSGVMLVVDAGRSRSQVVRRAKEGLDQLNVKILGAVLNKLTPRDTRGYYYSYYYSYADGKSQRRRRKQPGAASAPQAGPLARLVQPIRNRLSANGRSHAAEPIPEEENLR